MSKTSYSSGPSTSSKEQSRNGAPTSGSWAKRSSEQPPVPRKDYGRGLPPPGPSNYIVSTPNFLPFERHDDSKQGEERGDG